MTKLVPEFTRMKRAEPPEPPRSSNEESFGEKKTESIELSLLA